MQIIDHEPIVQNDFRGIYSRSDYDAVPRGMFIDALNNKYDATNVLTRDGTELTVDQTTGILRTFVYKRLNETPRFIWLDDSGNLFDSLYGPAIWTDASIVDFSLVNYNNRAYITVHNRVSGISSKKLLVYEGSGTARLAAGSAPSGFTLGAATSASSGSVEAGIHLLAVAYVTSSGFITAPGPSIFTQYTAPGSFKIDVSSLPIGPSTTAARYILASKSIPAEIFNGDQFGYELFFVPDGLINDNSSTTATIDFFDADLQESADYLIDNLAQIPAGLGVGVYNGRLILWGEDGNEFTVRASAVGEPESFSSISGFFNIDPSDAESGVRNCFEHRKSLIICTSNRLYQTSDNDSDPSTWAVNSIDKSVGTECFGVVTVLDARGVNTDRVWIASRPGLINFEGYARKPELSYNIEKIWQRINKAKFNLVQVVDDPIKHRILVSVPLDAATSISHILVGDYTECFTVYGTIDEKKIKWDIWTLPDNVVSIVGDLDSTTREPVYHFAIDNDTIVTMKDGLTNDYGNAIPTPYFVTDLKFRIPGWIHHFGGLKFRVTGSGTFTIDLYPEDGYPSSGTSITGLTLATAPNSEPDRLINFTNEKMAIKCGVSLIDENYAVCRIDTWIRPIWLRRPS